MARTGVGSGTIVSLAIALLALLAPLAACTTEESAPSCPNLASCYTMTMTVRSSDPTQCGPETSRDLPANWTDLTEDGSFISLNTGCKGNLSKCVFTTECPTSSGVPLKMTLTFSESGFSGTATQGECTADLSARRSECVAESTDAGADTAPAADGRVCSCTGKDCGDDGCGKTCGTCGKGYECALGKCDLDPDGLWSVTAQNAVVAPGTWDGDGSAPDPYFCLYGLTSPGPTCTTNDPAPETYAPTWNQVIVTSAKASDLLKGLDLEMKDEDLTTAGADDICTRVVKSVTEANLKSGTVNISCSVGASISSVVLKLTPL